MKRGLVVGLLMSMVVCMGSSVGVYAVAEETPDAKDLETSGDAEQIEGGFGDVESQAEDAVILSKDDLSSDEQGLLASIGWDGTSELTEWQSEKVLKYRAALKILGEKYPSYNLTIIYYTPDDWSETGYDTYMFVEDGYDTRYSLLVGNVSYSDGYYEAGDNFYGRVVREDYMDTLKGIINISMPEVVGVYTEFDSAETGNMNEEVTGLDIISDSETYQCVNNTNLYILDDGTVVMGDERQKLIESLSYYNGILGNYLITFVSDIGDCTTGDEIHEYVEKNKTATQVGFYVSVPDSMNSASDGNKDETADVTDESGDAN